MKKEPSKSGERTKLVMGIALMVFAVALSVGTYAYYQASITGNVSASIVAWECQAGGNSASFNLSLGDSLRPGSSGSLPITLSVSNFQAQFTISLANASNVPDNLNFYNNGTTQDASTCLSKTGASVTGCNLANYTETLNPATGSSAPSATDSKTTTIYYNWPVGTSAEPHTPTSNETATIDVVIVCNQLDVVPNGGAARD